MRASDRRDRADPNCASAWPTGSPLGTAGESPGAALELVGTTLESDFEYLARRAQHERELAAHAADPKAAMAHMYLAAAYGARVAELSVMPELFESLLDQIP
ncbi:MAG: hypothetical protein JWN69_1412 [Alphaproteobacteria bacterium]|nr:hypothetical protein [Alphaproteobacteria bacterium]